MVKIAMSTLVDMEGFCCGTVDVSQAFIQAEELAWADQAIGIPPECIIVREEKWNGAIVCDPKLGTVEELLHPP